MEKKYSSLIVILVVGALLLIALIYGIRCILKDSEKKYKEKQSRLSTYKNQNGTIDYSKLTPQQADDMLRKGDLNNTEYVNYIKCSTAQQRKNFEKEKQNRTNAINPIMIQYIEYLEKTLEINAKLKFRTFYDNPNMKDENLKNFFNEFAEEKKLEKTESLKQELEKHKNPLENMDLTRADLSVRKKLEDAKNNIKISEKTLEYNKEFFDFSNSKENAPKFKIESVNELLEMEIEGNNLILSISRNSGF